MERKKIVAISIITFIVIILATLSTILLTKVDTMSSELKQELLKSKNYTQISDKDSNVDGCDYVKFSSYFTRDLNGDGKAERLLGACRNINDTDQLYIDLNVITNGYLEDGKITINSTNFNYSMNMVSDSVLAKHYISDDVRTIELKDIKAGTQKLIIGNIVANIGNDTNNYSKVSSVTLEGTHVADDGVTKTPIHKTIDLTVDWHGETKTELYTKYQATTFYYNYDELDTNTISFSFRLDELQKELILKENIATITIPELNGHVATEVKCTNDNIESNYNNETKVLTIKRSGNSNEEGIITSTLPYSNSYNINVTYPKEAYDAISSYTTLTIPITGYYTGYNNEGFTNPYKSNIATGNITIVFRETPKGEIYNFYVDFEDKKYVSIPNYRYIMSKQDIINLYDSEEEIKNKEYVVRWLAVRGSTGEVPSMIMSETRQEDVEEQVSYGDKWNSTIMEDYVVNTGIYFVGTDEFLEENGSICVFNNDTNELIRTFTKEECNMYSAENPYKYDEQVKHIRVETTKANLNSSLSVYNIKELETAKILDDFTKDQIKDVELMYTYLTGICNIEGQSSETKDDIDCVYYVTEKSNSEITLEKNKISTQETINNQKIYIETIYYDQEGYAKWENGEFLVEVPKEIINMEINNVSICKRSKEDVEVVAYELFQRDGKYFIKIVTKNQEKTTYTIEINCNMTSDPRVPTSSKKFYLYSNNENCDDYYYKSKDIYDVDNDNNVEEQVGISDTDIYLLSPTSLITLETVSNYNNKDEITIAPNIAEVESSTRHATINIELTNNYPNTVSGVKILGKIPFKGNTYILNEKELKSDFTTEMTDAGISIPEQIKEKVAVYYSENENPTKDLLDTKNGWTLKENIQDFSKIKTYLIELNESTIDVGKGYTFNYTVNIPEDTNCNLKAFSDHAVFYELNTEGGNLQLSTEPNKVGLTVIKKFDLELTKHKENFNSLKVPGATYTIDFTDLEGDTKARIFKTNSNGKINMQDLYVGYKYVVKEIKSPVNYELNNEIIEFEITQDIEGNLKLQTNSNKVIYDEENEMVQITTEDEPKYKISFTKTDNKTGEKLSNVVFRLDGKNYITNRDGKIIVEGLELNKEYTLSEKRADGYYVQEDIIFKLVKGDNGDIQIESNNENVRNAIVINSEDSDLIQVEANITNERIPTYQLQILKVAENLNEEDIEKLVPLSGAKFKLESKDLDREQIMVTDHNGQIIINNLYQYVNGKYITGTYVLQEIDAPNGYSNVAEKIQFRVEVNAEGNLEIKVEDKENLKSIKNISIEENNIIKIVIEDKQLFKLTKTDAENNEPLENAEFVIYRLNDRGERIGYAKDVNGELIGNPDENGDYVISTNEQGVITLPLEGGYYQIVEVGYPEGYQEIKTERYFKIAGADENAEENNQNEGEADIEINYIEDLIDLSKNVNNGNSYSGKKIKLMRTLDFEEDSSYRNSLNTSYGDLNKDKTIQGIKAELTDRIDGCGFTPIGSSNITYFEGIFDGQRYEIRNLYINDNISDIGLFGSIKNAIIQNLGVTGTINNSGDGERYIGGIAGYSIHSTINYCYNECIVNVNGSTSSYDNFDRDYCEIIVGGIVGCNDKGYVTNCYNLGNISTYSKGIISTLTGGVVGYSCSFDNSISNCYNKGIVKCISDVIGYKYHNRAKYGNVFTGGILGRETGGTNSVVNVYNTGNVSSSIINDKNIGDNFTGGIIGSNINGSLSYGEISNCYNIGEVNSDTNSSESEMYTGTILGDGKASNCYYLESVELEDEKPKQGVVKLSSDYMKTNEFYEMLNADGTWVYIKDSYPKLAMSDLVNIEETTELKIKNTIKKLKITTEIGINSENARTGGSITGEYNDEYLRKNNIKFIEEVGYNSSNTKVIEIKPEDEYYINEIWINNEKIEFTEDENGVVSIPTGYFEEMKEDKHIVVKFERLIITKVDKDTNNKIPNTKFAIYSITPDKKVIDFAKNKQGEYIGEQNENNEYIVTTNENGQIKLLLPIGYYKAVETDAADGYVLEENEDLRTTYFKIGNITSDFDEDYIQNGKVTITNAKQLAQITIRKIDKDTKQKLAGAKFNIESETSNLIGDMVSSSQYTFVNNGTQYYSNNYGVRSSVANAYFPIDLREYTGGTYKLSINYSISSQANYDIGYATITTTPDVPAYNQNLGNINTSYRFIYASGSYSGTGSINLTGGQKYYLHIGYRKDGSTNTYNDRFYINSMDLIYSSEVETNGDGIANIKAPTGVYTVTEINAPLGYELNSNSQTVELLNSTQVRELIFENEKQNDFNEPNFILTKKDKVTYEVMPGVKFMVLDEKGNYVKDYTGTIVGEKEEINGEEKYVVTTDEKGQIKLKLKFGKYKLVEVQTYEGYVLEDEQEFEITNENIDYEFSWEANIISTHYPIKDYIRATSDGGMIQANYGINATIVAENTVDGKEITVTSGKAYVVKYNSEGKVNKLAQFTGLTGATAVYEDLEGNYIVVGEGKNLEIPPEQTVNGDIINLQYSGTNNRTIILKLNNELKVIWASKIDNFYPSNTNNTYIVEDANGEYIIGIYPSGTPTAISAEDTVNNKEIDLSYSVSGPNTILIKYTKDGKVKIAKKVPSGSPYSLKVKEDGGYILIDPYGYSGILELDSQMNLVRQFTSSLTGINLAYNNMYVTNDEGFIASGTITSNNVTINGDLTASGEEIQLTSETAPDTILIKYNKDLKIEWVKVNSFASQGISESNSYIKQDLQGNYISLVNISSPYQYKLVKYDQSGNVIRTIDLESSICPYMYLNNDINQVILMTNNKFVSYKLGNENVESLNIEITNQKPGRVTVHHLLEGTGPQYKDENGVEIPAVVLAEDEVLEGKVPDEYTTSPNMKIEGYTLIKDENGEYVIPENASGTYAEEEQHVYYYYKKADLKLTVHHYLEGTENKVPLGKNEQGEEIVAEDENYYYNEGDHYKTTPSQEVLKSYELVSVVGDEEKDIMQNEEVIYYYKIKKHEITTRVEIPEEELNSGRTEKGGSISGEGQAPYETVGYGKASVEDIVIKPDEGYRINQIRLVSTNEEGVKTESIIYINGKASEKEEIENAEITYRFNVDKSLTLTKFENMTEDKEIIVVFEPDEGKLIVHHYIEGTTEKIYDDQITIDLIGKEVETNPVRVENYVVVGEPADRVGTITKQIQEKIYYYQRQYKVTTDIIKYEEPNEKGEMEEVIGGTISGRGEDSYEDILKGRNSQKEIVIAPNEGFQITKITINGEEFDYSELLEEDGVVTLPEGFFKNVDEDKHIEVEFRRKTKVHVKYLEAGTKNVLAEEELIEGYVGKDFETERKNVPNYKTAKVGSETGITNEAQEAIQPNGQMTKDEMIIIYWYEKVPSGILVKHVEKVVTKTINEETGKEEITVTGVILDEEVIPGYAGEIKDTERRKLEGKYEGYISAENVDATEGINVGKDEDRKTVTMKQDEVVEVVYWYERAFKITTDVKEHEETIVDPETGETETVNVKGGSISGEDETPYESVIRSNDSTKAIKIVPEEGYRIKQVTINGEEIFIKDKIAEDKSLTLTKENGYFKNVQEDKHIEVEFEKIPARVIVHYYLQGTGEEFENEPVVLADEDIIIGTVNGKYITIPNMDIEGYTLIKDEKGEYILPENKTGIFTEKDTHVYYYYTKDPFELIVHHYLEGTKEKLADDEHYYYDEGTHYKTNPSEEVLESYELAKVVGDEEKDITKNEEVIYYYKIKKYEIITRVEIPEEELNSGRTEKGGTILGEGQTPYETVDHGKESKEDIIVIPDKGYRIKEIRLVSTKKENNKEDKEEVKTESIIYINGTEKDKEEQENAEITYKENLDGSLILTKFKNMTEDKEVIVVFEPVIGKVIVHHYIEGTTEKISEDEVTEDLVGTEVQTKPVEKENYVVVEEPKDKNTIITEDTQEKIYYYQRQYKVTTNIIKYEEPDENGKMKEVIGGTISGKGETSYEDILKGRNNQKEIEITPKDGFQITKITINGKELDYSELLKEDGSITLPKEFFRNIDENKHVEVEFRRKTKVHVKYLEAGIKKELAKEELIDGYVGKDFETERKNVTNYKTAKIGSETGITNEKEEAIQPNGQMTKDEITIIYWYEKIPAGIIVKHVEKVTTKKINEETGKEEIKITGVLLDEEEISGYVGESKNTERRKLEGKYECYIPAENKEAQEGINVGKEENSKIVTFKENEVTEVVYWYEKEFKITTDVIEHKETVVNTETGKEETVKVKGGSISGEDEEAYEKVISSNDSTKEIKIVPDKDYRIKQILINDKEIIIDEKVAEDGSIILKAENGYFTNMQEDKHIEVEFEKIPAKVIVKYKDSYTKESIVKDKIINGYVDDQYNETRLDIKNYIPAEPEPENSTGTMTKETITITYWYTREFKITTDVKEHEEKIINSETGKEEKVKVKGGSITGEDAESYEVVTRGETSTKEIIIKPENGYRIKLLTINGKEIEIKDLIKEDNILELPFFENMQEDKHIVVEFEKIPAKVTVKYLEEGTEKPIYKTEDGKEYEEINGYVNEKYETKEKEILYYELVKEKYPENSKGSMTEKETEVKYYYKKLLFNMKIEKEIEKITLNGQNVEITDKNKQKLEIKYKELKETKLEITYKIKVTNTEKIEGIAIIEEMLPEGFEFVKEEDTIWKEKDGKYTLTTEVINPGETKEYEITLKWNPEEVNKGQKVNIAKIANTVNIPEYEETTLEDNEDTAIIEIKLNKTIEDVINMPKTGQERIVYIVAILVVGTCIGIIVWREKKNSKK